MTYLTVGCRALLGIVFVVAAVGKLRGSSAFTGFVGSIRRMRILPPALALPIAVAVVVAESVAALALIVPVRDSGTLAFGLAALLLLTLTAGIARALSSGNDEPCRCFGRSETPLGARHVARNLALFAVAVGGLLCSLGNAPTDPGVSVVAAVAGMVTGSLVVMFDDLVDLAWPTLQQRPRQ
ncbi:MAG TPA: MauE/DoxX family redox-associated membrane protein [Umezawaea sp.]|nr:MauE/DoxX family redox-associated membrane protein [Umezawaea sp.]